MMLSVGKHLRPGLWLTPNWPRKWQKTFKPIRNSDDCTKPNHDNMVLLTLIEVLLQIFCKPTAFELSNMFVLCLFYRDVSGWVV